MIAKIATIKYKRHIGLDVAVGTFNVEKGKNEK